MAVVEVVVHHNDKVSGTVIAGTDPYTGGLFGAGGVGTYVDIGGGNIVARWTCAASQSRYGNILFPATTQISFAGRLTLRNAPSAWAIAREVAVARSAGKSFNALIQSDRKVWHRDSGDALLVASAGALEYDVPYIFQLAGQAGAAGLGASKIAVTRESDGSQVIPPFEDTTCNTTTTTFSSLNMGIITASAGGGAGMDWDDIRILTDTYALIDPYTSLPTASHTKTTQQEIDFSASTGSGLVLTLTHQSGPVVVPVVTGLIGRFDEVARTTDVVLAYTLTNSTGGQVSGTIVVPPPSPPERRIGPLVAIANAWN